MNLLGLNRSQIFEDLSTLLFSVLSIVCFGVTVFCAKSQAETQNTTCAPTPKNPKSRNPQNDLILNCPWIVPSGTQFSKKPRTLTIGPSGRILITNAKGIEFSDFHFIWNPGPVTILNPGTLLEMTDSSDLSFRRNSLIIDRGPLHTPTDWKPNTTIGTVIKARGTISNFLFEGNNFNAGSELGFELLNPSGKKRSWKISNNRVTRFYNVFDLTDCIDCVIDLNRLRENAGNNFLISGKNIKVIRNSTWFAGYGIHGDALSLGDVEHIEIRRNRFVFGYCYGIWFYTRARDVVIEGNLITGGVTSGLAFQNTSNKDPSLFQGIKILRNLFYNNSAHALFIQDGRDIKIEENYFVANNPFFGISKATSASQKIVLKNNKYLSNDTATTGVVPNLVSNELKSAVPWDDSI